MISTRDYGPASLLRCHGLAGFVYVLASVFAWGVILFATDMGEVGPMIVPLMRPLMLLLGISVTAKYFLSVAAAGAVFAVISTVLELIRRRLQVRWHMALLIPLAAGIAGLLGAYSGDMDILALVCGGFCIYWLAFSLCAAVSDHRRIVWER